ncbi:MAG TPA: tyrosine-type recombinase/integrase [Acetobacteraceae bacterium]|nr:tyrosine-type recombinase/integrase [Acetobacteraceae bacterium]
MQFELLESIRASMLAWLEHRGGTVDEFVFPSRIDHADHISTLQCAPVVDEWITGIGLRREDCGTHPLRRTKASIIHKQTGNLRAVQILLGHTKIESTVRYLGVDVEDALALSEGTELQQIRWAPRHVYQGPQDIAGWLVRVAPIYDVPDDVATSRQRTFVHCN